MIDVHLLEQLVAFAKEGTLSKAAEKLNITQPALSRSMKHLEEIFGFSLFDRSKSKISLNETGRFAVTQAETVLRAHQEMFRLTVSYDRNRRSIQLGSCAPMPINELVPMLQALFPDMSITSEVIRKDLLSDGLNQHLYQLAILNHPAEDKRIYSQPFIRENLCIIVPPDHPFTRMKALSFQDLKGSSIIVGNSIGFWENIVTDNADGIRLLVQNSMEAIDELVAASSLPVFNSDLSIKLGFDTQGRVAIPIADDVAHVTYHLACLKENTAKYKSVFHAIRSIHRE